MHCELANHQRISMQQHAEQQAQHAQQRMQTFQMKAAALAAAPRRQRHMQQWEQQLEITEAAMQAEQDLRKKLARATGYTAAQQRVLKYHEQLGSRFKSMSDMEVLQEPKTPPPPAAAP